MNLGSWILTRSRTGTTELTPSSSPHSSSGPKECLRSGNPLPTPHPSGPLESWKRPSPRRVSTGPTSSTTAVCGGTNVGPFPEHREGRRPGSGRRSGISDPRH